MNKTYKRLAFILALILSINTIAVFANTALQQEQGVNTQFLAASQFTGGYFSR